MHQVDGATAEDRVATYLETKGYEIVVKNWKVRSAEIDIVAAKDDELFFIEVKYRKDDSFGLGHEYVAHAKLRQMEFASTVFMHSNKHLSDKQIQLKVASVIGMDFEIELFDVID